MISLIGCNVPFQVQCMENNFLETYWIIIEVHYLIAVIILKYNQPNFFENTVRLRKWMRNKEKIHSLTHSVGLCLKKIQTQTQEISIVLINWRKLEYGSSSVRAIQFNCCFRIKSWTRNKTFITEKQMKVFFDSPNCLDRYQSSSPLEVTQKIGIRNDWNCNYSWSYITVITIISNKIAITI